MYILYLYNWITLLGTRNTLSQLHLNKMYVFNKTNIKKKSMAWLAWKWRSLKSREGHSTCHPGGTQRRDLSRKRPALRRCKLCQGGGPTRDRAPGTKRWGCGVPACTGGTGHSTPRLVVHARYQMGMWVGFPSSFEDELWSQRCWDSWSPQPPGSNAWCSELTS